jgi:TetR/AcrR family transcriptional repressor of nem operon
MSRPQEYDRILVLEQAMRLFWSKGYEATSLGDLLAETGLSKSSLYAVFGSKRGLFLEAFDAYRAERVTEMNRILATGSGREGLEAFFTAIISDASAVGFHNGCMSINQAVELAPRDKDIQTRVVNDLAVIEDALTITIERGVSDGSIVSKMPSRDLAQLFVTAFPGFQVMVRASANRNRLETALRVMLACCDA